MNELVETQRNLPDAPEDLARFSLLMREKLVSVRAEIRAIDKAKLAKEVRDQKKEEARMISEALLDAEMKLGDFIRTLPKKPGKRTDLQPHLSTEEKSSHRESAEKSKQEVIEDLGISKMQAERFETLSKNKDLVELAKVQARENDDIPTRTQVLNMVRAKQRKLDQDINRIDTDYQITKQFHDAVYGVIGLPDDAGTVQAFMRGVGSDITLYLENIDSAIKRLRHIKTVIQTEKGGKHNAKR